MIGTKATKRISLPITSWVSEDGRIYMSVKDGEDLLSTASGAKESKAKRQLQRQVLDCLKAEQARDRHFQRRLIATNDGTMLLVEYRHGWEYRITRQGSTGGSACMMGPEATFEEVHEAALRHANSAYGGVAWEAPL